MEITLERQADGSYTTARPTAHAEAPAALEGLTSFRIGKVPVGLAVVGGGTALLLAEVIDGLFEPEDETMEALFNIGGAWAVLEWGPGLIGERAAEVASIILAFEGSRHILPVDKLVSTITERIKGIVEKKAEAKAGVEARAEAEAPTARARTSPHLLLRQTLTGA